jgi:hypothetical protein
MCASLVDGERNPLHYRDSTPGAASASGPLFRGRAPGRPRIAHLRFPGPAPTH